MQLGGKKSALEPNPEIDYFSLQYSYFGIQETCLSKDIYRVCLSHLYIPFLSASQRHNVDMTAIVNRHSPQYFPECLNSKLISQSPDFIMILSYSASIACLERHTQPWKLLFLGT